MTLIVVNNSLVFPVTTPIPLAEDKQEIPNNKPFHLLLIVLRRFCSRGYPREILPCLYLLHCSFATHLYTRRRRTTCASRTPPRVATRLRISRHTLHLKSHNFNNFCDFYLPISKKCCIFAAVYNHDVTLSIQYSMYE